MTRSLKTYAYAALVLALYAATYLPPDGAWAKWSSLLVRHVYLFALLGAGVALYALPPARCALSRVGRAVSALSAAPEFVFPLAGAAAFFCLTYTLSGSLFSHWPTELDSMAQYAGAKIFAQGHWVLPSHPLAAFFDTPFFVNDGAFYTFYPPGHMLLLAVGHVLGNPAMVNPLLGALSLLAVYFLTREIGGVGAARWSAALFLLSPFIVFLASEYDNRATALLCATLFALFYIKTLKRKSPGFGLLAGVALGYLFITRPQTAVPFVLPFAVHGAWLVAVGWRAWWRAALAVFSGAAPFATFFLYYNLQTTGDPLLTGYQKVFGPGVVPASTLLAPGGWQSWMDGINRAVEYLRIFHKQLFGWPVSSLFLVLGLFLFRAQKPFCGLLAAVFFSVVFSLTLTPYVYVIFGPRYLYEVSGLVVALSALALARLPAMARARGHVRVSRQWWRGAMLMLMVFLSGTALFTDVKGLYAYYGNNYRSGRPDIARFIEQSVQKPVLVLIPQEDVYESLTYRQPPLDSNDIIFARDRGAENQLILRYYPERNVYIWESPGRLRLLRRAELP